MPELTKRNKQLLKKKNPALYESMINYQPGTLFHPIVTSSGLHTLLHVPSGGEPRFIHSPADPMDEARELIAGRKFRDGEMTVLFGCGLGYLPLSIVESMPPHHKLIVVEASMDILVRACQLMDLSPLLSDERVDVLSADQTYDIMNLLDSQQLNIIGGRINKLIYPPCFELHAEQYRKVECKIENAVASIKNNYINLQRHGDWTAKNILENLLHIPSSVPITPLCDMARGMPAFVVAAGPSLDRNIDKLKDIKGRGLIIAVDAALKPLAMKGIKADLVVSGDPVEANLKKFDGLSRDILDQVPLVFSPYVYPAIPARFAKAKYYYNEDNLLSQWALTLCGNPNTLSYGFSIAHYAFYLARFMGASPIIFVGLDLAFPEKRAHATDSAPTWDLDWAKEDYPTVTDIHGKQVSSIQTFIDAITLFEKEIGRTESLCIDATEGGAFIPGTRVMELREAIQRYVKDNGNTMHIDFQGIWEKRPQFDISGLKKGLFWLEKEADEIQVLCNSALDLLSLILARLGSENRDNHDLQENLQKLNRIADLVSTHEQYKKIIKDRTTSVIVEQYCNQFKLARVKTEDERLLIETRQSRLFFDQMRHVAESLSASAASVLKKMEGAIPR